MKYTKVLQGKNSPQNKCYANDGEWLIVAPEDYKINNNAFQGQRFFIGVDSHLPSKFGWVTAIDHKITANDLANMFHVSPPDETIKLCEYMLKEIGKQKDGAAVACRDVDVDILGVYKRKLKIHKVFFYGNYLIENKYNND